MSNPSSTIILYKDTKIIPSRNMVVDSLSDYLATLTKLTINDFQYQRHHLEMDIKIDKTQVWQEFEALNNYNYLSIQNSDSSRVVYYFIMNKTQYANSTIKLQLMMDTANTFQWNVDFTPTEKTLVKRMHKDRFTITDIQGELNTTGKTATNNGMSTGTEYDVELRLWQGGELVKTIACKGILRAFTGYYILYFSGISLDDYNWMKEHNSDSFSQFVMKDANAVRNFSIYSATTLDEITFNVVGQRVIDLKSEEISAPVYKANEEEIYENEGEIQNSWSLYYRTDTDSDNSPIRCYLMPSQNITIRYGGSGNKITPSDVPNGEYLFFCAMYNGAFNFIVGDETYRVYNGIKNPFSNVQDFFCVAIKNNGGTLELYSLVYRWTPLIHTVSIEDTKSLTRVLATTTTGFEFDLNAETIKARQMTTIAQTYDDRNPNRPFLKGNWNVEFNLTTQVSYMNSIDAINRTLPENIKIIDIPYSPSTITIDENDNYVFEGIWQFDVLKKWFLLNNLNTRFENNIVSNIDDFLNEFAINIGDINTSTNRYLKDSKLYHSDYYRPKFIYDSFSKIFPLEQIDYEKTLENKSSSKFEFSFIMTRNIVSKFLFRFNYTYKHANEDYPNIVAIARNNEEVIYNSAYLNYIRTGYNYDLKSKERNEVASGVGLGLSVASLLASVGLAASGYGSAIGIAGIVGSLGGIAGSVLGMAKSTAQAEDNIQRKLQETQRQSVSVLNADDSDLLYAYTNNKAKMCLYKVSQNMENVLDDMFYYAGYIVNEQMIPNVNTRCWFNFLQCDLDLLDTGKNISKELLDDLKARYSNGITFLHKVNGMWNFEQDKENWEVSLL